MKREIAAGRAKAVLRRRKSGWWDWGIVSYIGETIGGDANHGTEKQKMIALRLANERAKIHNEALRAEPTRWNASPIDRRPNVGKEMADNWY